MGSQHTVLFGVLNRMREAMMKGQARKMTGELLLKMVKYTSDRFKAE